ncbi:MAG: hypothetical protein AB7R89_13895 [Dehalococcoidia bacterium]
MTVGDLIQALWFTPCWLVLGVGTVLAAGGLLAGCATISLIEARERHGTREQL